MKNDNFSDTGQQPAGEAADDNIYDLKSVVDAVKKSRKLVILTFLTVMIVSTAVFKSVKPVYQANCMLQLGRVYPESLLLRDRFTLDRYFKRDEMLERYIKDLNLSMRKRELERRIRIGIATDTNNEIILSVRDTDPNVALGIIDYIVDYTLKDHERTRNYWNEKFEKENKENKRQNYKYYKEVIGPALGNKVSEDDIKRFEGFDPNIKHVRENWDVIDTVVIEPAYVDEKPVIPRKMDLVIAYIGGFFGAIGLGIVNTKIRQR